MMHTKEFGLKQTILNKLVSGDYYSQQLFKREILGQNHAVLNQRLEKYSQNCSRDLNLGIERFNFRKHVIRVRYLFGSPVNSDSAIANCRTNLNYSLTRSHLALSQE